MYNKKPCRRNSQTAGSQGGKEEKLKIVLYGLGACGLRTFLRLRPSFMNP